MSSNFDELHPRGQAGNAGQFTTKISSAPAVGLEDAPTTEVQWTGPDDGRLIYGHTNPWLRDVDGEPIDLQALRESGKIRMVPIDENGCDTCLDDVVPGAITAMDTPDGIQCCDSCGRIEGDLPAAAAVGAELERQLGRPAGSIGVWFSTPR